MTQKVEPYNHLISFYKIGPLFFKGNRTNVGSYFINLSPVF
jgi:hypothetical protein